MPAVVDAACVNTHGPNQHGLFPSLGWRPGCSQASAEREQISPGNLIVRRQSRGVVLWLQSECKTRISSPPFLCNNLITTALMLYGSNTRSSFYYASTTPGLFSHFFLVSDTPEKHKIAQCSLPSGYLNGNYYGCCNGNDQPLKVPMRRFKPVC